MRQEAAGARRESGVTIWSKIDFVVDVRNLLFGCDFDLPFSKGCSHENFQLRSRFYRKMRHLNHAEVPAQHLVERELGEEAIDTPFCSLQEKFQTSVLRGLRDISEAP